MQGKRVVLTGATSGIGRSTALALGKLGASLILVSRNETEGAAMVARLSASSPASEFAFIAADLSSLAQVRAAVAEIIARWSGVDVLINNAGARFDRYEQTPEGHERTFATNHLGHFLLTGLLLDCLAQSPAARIINVASSAAAQAKNDGRWQYNAGDYDRRQAYAKSKLANLFFTRELARRVGGSGIQCFAVDPGVVATRFARNNGLLPWLKHLVSHGRKLELRSARAGADTIVHLATASPLPADANGECFRDRQPTVVCPASTDPAAASSLWEISVRLTGIEPCPPPGAGRHLRPSFPSN
jgi:NAD(P)-dependent dehydrogenase (short-subunit alcohol dehydrogenase family)